MRWVEEKATVRVTTEVPKRVVFMPNHFTDSPVNALTADLLDHESGFPEYKGIPARIRKA